MKRIPEKLRNMGCKVKKKQCFTDYVSYLSTRVEMKINFSLHKKVAKRSEKKQKRCKKYSKLAILSKTKRNIVTMPQFRLHEPLKTILTHKETCEKFCE
jgi:hypothetical protein